MTLKQENQSKPDAAVEKGAVTRISLDAWAVTLAFAASLLIWTGVIKHIPW
jgi:hypothetical protein